MRRGSRNPHRLLFAALGLALVGAGPPSGGKDALRAPEGGALVVHVWATWCAPCLAELEGVAEFYRGAYPALAEQGLRLVIVSQDVREQDLARYLAEHAPPFPVLLDTLGETGDRLALRGLPGTVVIDARGEVLARMPGPQDWRSQAFAKRLEGFLAR